MVTGIHYRHHHGHICPPLYLLLLPSPIDGDDPYKAAVWVWPEMAPLCRRSARAVCALYGGSSWLPSSYASLAALTTAVSYSDMSCNKHVNGLCW